MRKTLLPLVAVALAVGLPACRKKEAPPDPSRLVADLRSPDRAKSGDARLALIRMGEPAVAPLAALLRGGEPRDRITAANTLWGMGMHAKGAVPDLAAALEDPDPELRVTAAMVLESLGPAAEPAVAALTSAVGDRDPRVRQAAVKALGAIGPGARAALPTLTRALRRGSWPEAEEAVRRIRRLDAGAVIELGPEGPGEAQEP
jgi:HEAT repeat protein